VLTTKSLGSINQTDIPERGAQVKQMRRIFESAKTVVIWLGPDNQAHQAPLAIDSVRQITNFLCQKLGISFEDLMSEEEVYHEIIFKNKGQIPLPHECDFVTKDMWESLLWLYKHPYFTRLWAIQEINATKYRMAHCGSEIIQWVAIELVAGYIILETTFSKSHGFTNAFCWWASTAPSGLRQAKNWLHMLYLASNFAATDPRDVIYGLRGMMKSEEAGWLLDPDYSKSTLQVYRDSVEAAFIDYKTTNALLYVSGVEDPSWVPRWDRPMLFRNPFRFGKPVPWKPAGESRPVWSIDKDANVLSLTGFVLDSIEFVEPYYETFFGSTMIASDEGKLELKQAWHRILGTMTKSLSHIPFSNSILAATATSFSFGLDKMCDPTDERCLFHNFVAYLKNVLDEETYNKYISLDTSEECKDGNGDAFGKPVWDFEYPVASFFITKRKMIGCSVTSTTPGDLVYVPLGCVYPLVLRPDSDQFRIRGFCFVHDIMQGEKQDSPGRVVEIR
jgi:Heterokaryon incompatibility protein (HET)